MKNSYAVYTTPDGRHVRIPDDLAERTKFTKDGLPDKRLKANAEFVAWADEQDKMPDAPPSTAQHYALRVWCGQSITAPRSWRVERVKEALEGQGLSFDGVELP